MTEIRALSAGLEQDLRPLSLYLWQQSIPHRVSEHAGQQILWVRTEAEAEQVRLLYQHWRQGRLQLKMERRRKPLPSTLLIHPGHAPLTLVLLVLSILGFLLVMLDRQLNLLHLLTFFEFDRYGSSWIFSLPKGEYWRLLTPIFLHFSLLHIVFNGLWLWDLGRRVEQIQGAGRLLVLVLLVGIGSNLAQAMFAPAGVFGGMSGVIYGLLGYCWLWSRISGDNALEIPGVVLAVMLGWLVLCMAGFAELLGVGAVANAAHLGGLLMGLLLGGAGAWLSKSRSTG